MGEPDAARDEKGGDVGGDEGKGDGGWRETGRSGSAQKGLLGAYKALQIHTLGYVTTPPNRRPGVIFARLSV